MPRSSCRSRAYLVCSLVPEWSNSQPMCAYQRPVTAPLKPLPCPWGVCGSPSWSVWAWCLRWSATQFMTGPSTAIDPTMARKYSTGL